MNPLVCVVVTTSRQWSDAMVKGIATAAKERRKALGLTAAEVAERTSAGKPLSRAVISDLETGRKRTLDIAELVTLADALECSPLALLFPDALADTERFPGDIVPVLTVLRSWIHSDRGIRTAIDLAQVDHILDLKRTFLERRKLYGPDENLEHLRADVELLEAERRRLIDVYKQETDGSSNA